MKHKFKPVAKAEIRERVEQKFRARGAVAFHLLLILGFGILFLYNLPELWAMRDFSGEFQQFMLLYGIFGMSGALHFIRYYFRHGRGRDRHESETDDRIAGQLRNVNADHAEELEELVRLQTNDKRKNLRLVWQHVVIFIGIVSMGYLLNLQNLRPSEMFDWSRWQDFASFFGIWGIGLAAHVLRCVFAYGSSAAGREAKIQAQVAAELARAQREAASSDARGGRRDGSLAGADEGDNARALSLEDLDASGTDERTASLHEAGR